MCLCRRLRVQPLWMMPCSQADMLLLLDMLCMAVQQWLCCLWELESTALCWIRSVHREYIVSIDHVMSCVFVKRCLCKRGIEIRILSMFIFLSDTCFVTEPTGDILKPHAMSTAVVVRDMPRLKVYSVTNWNAIEKVCYEVCFVLNPFTCLTVQRCWQDM